MKESALEMEDLYHVEMTASLTCTTTTVSPMELLSVCQLENHAMESVQMIQRSVEMTNVLQDIWKTTTGSAMIHVYPHIGLVEISVVRISCIAMVGVTARSGITCVMVLVNTRVIHVMGSVLRVGRSVGQTGVWMSGVKIITGSAMEDVHVKAFHVMENVQKTGRNVD